MPSKKTPRSGPRGAKQIRQQGRASHSFRPFLKSDPPLKANETRCANTALATESRHPRSLIIVWGCYHGGVETAVRYRLLELNRVGAPAHAYFYYSGKGISNFEKIPTRVSNKSQDLKDYINLHQFDVVTFVNTLYNLEAVAESGFAGTYIFEMHGFAPAILEELNRINQHQDGGRIKAVVVPGQHVAAIASAALWRRPDIKLFIARNPVDTELFRRRSADLFQQGTLLQPEWTGSPLLGWVGRMEPNKNWRLLLQVFSRVKALHPATRLLVVCDKLNSPETAAFHQAARDYGLDDDVRVLQNVSYEQMPDYYSLIAESGGALLSTSYSEGYPYHLLEAQACTCPVVCSLAGGNPEVVAHGATGFVFSMQSPDDAVDYVHKLLTQPNLRQQIGIEERKKVCAQNSVEQNVHQYLNWLHEVVRTGAGRM